MSATNAPAPSADLPSPLSIRITAQTDGTYKSIGAMEWNDIPPFAVLTGANGVGKSHLLEFLAHKLMDTVPADQGPLFTALGNMGVETNDHFPPGSVAYVPPTWDMGGSPAVGIPELRKLQQDLWQAVRTTNLRSIRQLKARLDRVELALGRPIAQAGPEALSTLTSQNLNFLLDSEDVIFGLAYSILSYRARRAERLEKGTSVAEILKELGPPPWQIINDALKSAGFTYRINDPEGTAFLDHYRLQLSDEVRNVILGPEELSSGEKAILRTALWLHNSRQGKHFPKLFLIDEPDSHLHPALTQQMLDVLQEVFVKQDCLGHPHDTQCEKHPRVGAYSQPCVSVCGNRVKICKGVRRQFACPGSR